VYERYRDMDIGRMRTDEDGAILLHFGAQVNAASYRRRHARYWYGQ
jgi:competence protein ComEC